MISSVKLFFLTVTMAAGGAGGFACRLTAAQTPCEQLRSLSLPDATITAAKLIPAGTVPAHCRVAAALTPSTDSHIEMEVWLPTADAWNGKFQAVGNGGWAGIITTGTPNPQPIARTMSSALKE